MVDDQLREIPLPGTASIWTQCHLHCQEAAETVRDIVARLQSDIREAKIRGSIRAVLQAGAIKRESESLKDAKLNLLMVQNMAGQ